MNAWRYSHFRVMARFAPKLGNALLPDEGDAADPCKLPKVLAGISQQSTPHPCRMLSRSGSRLPRYKLAPRI